MNDCVVHRRAIKKSVWTSQKQEIREGVVIGAF